MRLPDELRRCVVFVGQGTGDEFLATGTGFLIAYKSYRYLVNAAHVAYCLGQDPFSIRVNTRDGKCDVVVVDPIDEHKYRWLYNLNDPTVDIAVMPFNIDFKAENWEQLLLPDETFIHEIDLKKSEIGPGDFCYTIGLFQLHMGKTRNLPIVHSGNLALMAGEERISVKAWQRENSSPPTHSMEAHLVEAANLQGLSGAPVFVRKAVDFDFRPVLEITMRGSSAEFYLLGVWHGSWEGEAVQRPGTRVPVGVGIVTPTSKLIELLETPEIAEIRNEWITKLATTSK